MCVALPGRVISVDHKSRQAQVDFNGSQVTARAGLVAVNPGDRVLVHAGCILQKVSDQEADELAALMEELGAM